MKGSILRIWCWITHWEERQLVWGESLNKYHCPKCGVKWFTAKRGDEH